MMDDPGNPGYTMLAEHNGHDIEIEIDKKRNVVRLLCHTCRQTIMGFRKSGREEMG